MHLSRIGEVIGILHFLLDKCNPEHKNALMQ